MASNGSLHKLAYVLLLLCRFNSQAALQIVDDSINYIPEEPDATPYGYLSTEVLEPSFASEEESFDHIVQSKKSIFLSSTDSCSSASSCENCTALSKWYGGCHWCSHDQSCHAVGSFYGCAIGSSCGISPNPNDSNQTDDDRTCFAQRNCRDCALLSHLCHWCGHDNACHVIGSVSGCVTGVDCYSIDRCQRKEPEPLPVRQLSIRSLPTQLGIIPLLCIGSIASLILCCLTTCCCVTSGLKNAYDELADIAQRGNSANHDNIEELTAPLLPQATTDAVPITVVEDVTVTNPVGKGVTEASPLVVESENNLEADPLSLEQGNTPAEASTTSVMTTTRTTTTRLLSTTTTTVINNNLAVARTTTRSRHRSPRSMQRLYNACVCCYVSTVFVVLSICALIIVYYPRQPVYNICNNAVAWKSLIDSLTSMKVTADFEILASFSNPNHLDVALDMGKGSFTHQGAFVGTFDIPPVLAPANSITDMLIVAHLTPDKWDALSLTAEYYSGKLVLNVDASAVVRFPQLWDYTIKAGFEDLQVNVNEKSDRSLCGCPTWDDPPSNKTGGSSIGMKEVLLD